MESLVGLDDLILSHDIDFVDDKQTDWIEDQGEPERLFEQDIEQMHDHELTNLMVLEWLHPSIVTR